MDEVNKSGPYYEAVSLCYFNGNDSGWSWTRVADAATAAEQPRSST